MKANKDEEQALNSKVADMIEQLQKQLDFLDSNCLTVHKLKTLWTRAAISSLQGYLNVDNPLKHWEDVVKKGADYDER